MQIRVGGGSEVLTVGSGSHGQALSADLEREDLASYDPSNGSPSGGKEEDEETDEGNGRFLRSDVLNNGHTLRGLAQGCGADDGNHKLRGGHADRAPEEKWTTTPFVDCVQAGDSGGDVDGGGDHLDGEGILDAGVLEDWALSVTCS